MLPVSGCASPISILIVVVFPAPFGPRKPKNDPWGTPNDNPSTACTPLKTLWRSTASIAAACESWGLGSGVIDTCRRTSFAT